MDAARGADLVTSDVWTSMGFEAENGARRRYLQDWQVDAETMRAAAPDALFMHCLPAHRGEEVSAEVIVGRRAWSGTRPRTVCTRRRPCWNTCCSAA